MPFKVPAELGWTCITDRGCNFSDRLTLACNHEPRLVEPHGLQILHGAAACQGLEMHMVRWNAHARFARQRGNGNVGAIAVAQPDDALNDPAGRAELPQSRNHRCALRTDEDTVMQLTENVRSENGGFKRVEQRTQKTLQDIRNVRCHSAGC